MNWKWIKKSMHSSNHSFSTIYAKEVSLSPVITRCLFRIAVVWLRRLSPVEQETPAVPPRPPLLHPRHPPALTRLLARNRTTATMDTRLDTKHTMMSRPHSLTIPGPSASLAQARVPVEMWISDWQWGGFGTGRRPREADHHIIIIIVIIRRRRREWKSALNCHSQWNLRLRHRHRL